MNVDSILISEYASVSSAGELTAVRVFSGLVAHAFPATHEWLAISLIVEALAVWEKKQHE